MAFEFNKIYEVNLEWKQYFDGFGDDCLGYYYVTPEDWNISYEIQECLIINKNKECHPNFVKAIPFKFSDCKLCSLSSTAELKLFKIVNLLPIDYEVEEAIIVETDEEAAAKLYIEDFPRSATRAIEYLGDYYGKLKAGSVILSK